jgi:hypothetical protein
VRLRLKATACLGAAILCVLPLRAKNGKHLVEVVAKPTAESFEPHTDVTVKVTITNNAAHAVSFFTCPNPYVASLESVRGPLTPRTYVPPPEKNDETISPGPLKRDLLNCVSSILLVVKPGESVPTQVSLTALYGLDVPGSYTGRITWRFDREEVRSNSFQITIRPKPQS